MIINLEVEHGEKLIDVITAAIKLATASSMTVKTQFNQTKICVRPGDDVGQAFRHNFPGAKSWVQAFDETQQGFTS
jgi:hypothetical protein